MARPFAGGIHPPERKLGAARPIEVLPPPAEVAVPLAMHLGAPAKAIVQGGERVLRGQMIAEAGGFVSANIHSPVSGTVRKIEPRDHILGRPLPAIVIDNDGQDETVDPTPVADWENAPAEALLDAVFRAGIVGMGGATFPTHVKLKPPPAFKIDTLIANGVECEPYLTADHRLMLERPDDVLTGLRVVMRILGVDRAFVGIERNKPDAIALMRERAKGLAGIEVVDLQVKYPQGAEKQLIFACTGRQVPSGGLPMNVNAVVQNVGTLAAIAAAVVEGKPLTDRIASVTGEAVREPKNLLIRVGTPLRLMLEAAGGANGDLGKVIAGGPMMGIAQANLAASAMKGTSGLLCLPDNLARQPEPLACIRCGTCVRGCPAHLLPTEIYKAIRVGNFDRAEKLGALDCIECGSCSFACPAGIPLVQWLRLGKAEILARRKKKS